MHGVHERVRRAARWLLATLLGGLRHLVRFETASCRAGGRWFHWLTCRSCGTDMGSPRRAALVCLPDSPPGRQAHHPRSAGSHRGKPGTRRHRRGPCWRIGLTRPSPVVQKDDDEHRKICGSRIRGSFWQYARGHDERRSSAVRLG